MSVPFADRHIGIDTAAEQQMLEGLGLTSLAELMDAAVPTDIRSGDLSGSSLPQPVSEMQALRELRALAAENRVRRSMIGQGYYGTITPAVIQRMVLENPAWYTAYTPYQPEISQGRLEALLNFQTMVSDLTGLDVANSSMLDEATAVAEAMLLARRASKHSANTFVVDTEVLPQTRAVLAGRAAALGIELIDLDLAEADPKQLPEAFGLVVQYPGVSGRVWDPSAVLAAVSGSGGLGVVAADLLSLTLLAPPGELGADIAVGSTQRFGVPMGFGGPHAGYLAIRNGLERQLPGRLVGVSKDAQGHTAYRLALQTREQHIRRDKATSNICTAQVLLAVVAAMYAAYHGPTGLRAIAERVHAAAVRFAREASGRGLTVLHESYFDTVSVRVADADAAVAAAGDAGILIRLAASNIVSVSFDELNAAEVLDGDDLVTELVTALGGSAGRKAPKGGIGVFEKSEAQWFNALVGQVHEYPPHLARRSAYLTHEVFQAHHSETKMLRYLSRLARQDYALDRGMIPLGSCTMKLNAASEMAAISWPQFSDLHPFAPASDVAGTLRLIADLELWLSELTGYDTVSLQPNAGSQGELAGLLAIAGWHRSRGEEGRDVCLIPASAHGTNAASAVLAGMRVVVVATGANGDVDVSDLNAKIAEHAASLAALMVTYPSTHGVYEHGIRQACDAVHAAGGQVYIDGANLNALLGYAKFGEMGGDVSHLNLHKTFCIPHGGGGPGVGPVAAKAHLAPFLPGHPQAQSNAHVLMRADSPTAIGRIEHGGHPVSAAPFGSPLVLPIAWAYIRMMGAAGLQRATATAVLAANHVARRLGDHFPVLFADANGLVAHECILDLRPLRESTGVTVEDVAKRLIDFGFHAPTVSFPVAGTLMVEPTESEDLAELERFIAAMVAIRAEADSIAAGGWSLADSPLVNAPHPASVVVAENWERPYSRDSAAFPAPWLSADKYWPPVSRIDGAFGDRNLVCSCPPVAAFSDQDAEGSPNSAGQAAAASG